jgi:WD40 repeat protein
MTGIVRLKIRIFACSFVGIMMSQPGCQTREAAGDLEKSHSITESLRAERQITHGPGGRILTNTGVWSPDSEWIVYDTRSNTAGDNFDGELIEMVNVRTGEVRKLYRAKDGAHCGVATLHPRESKVVFILGPERPTPDWQYGPFHRQGVIVDTKGNGGTSLAINLDARDLTPPFTPGALRGGSHVHVWDAAGEWVSFTYEDHVLAHLKEATADNDINLRNIGVSVPARPVQVKKDHPRNHDGEYFTVLVTRTTANPKPGSDEIKKAFEEGWVGTNGYGRANGSRQRHALAFQGHVVTANGEAISEVFIADLPDDLTQAGNGPLAGTETRMPFPPKGCVQRRLTFTAQRRFPGIQGPRHWLRCSPDGSRIAFLMKDDAGIVQLWTVSPNGGPPRQLTCNSLPIASTFTWSPDGRFIAHVMDNSVCLTEGDTGKTIRLTTRSDDATAPRPEACVFSPNGEQIAFVRSVPESGRAFNQIFVVGLSDSLGR